MIDFDVVTGSGPIEPREKPAALPAASALQLPSAAPAPGAAAAAADRTPKPPRPAEG
ncbi:MAG TPA: hypothetical protein VMU85_09685 [Stellaceae bacterium]|nr:hypothetical protein [Stellaceae bacterium]